MDVGVKLIGERRVALRFEKFPDFARANLLAVITDYQARLQEAIAAKIPRGRSGKIAAALEGGVEDNSTKVRGWVSLAGGDRLTVLLPAIALEYGSNRAIKVAAREGRGLKTVYGRYVAPMLVNVSAYDRQTNIAAQRFLRGPLDELSSSAIAAMEKAVASATTEET